MQTQEQEHGFFTEADVICTYSRAQAIEDGMLIDATEMAKEAGIKFPVALTQELWARWVEPTPAMQELGQSVEGRLWDVLWMFRCAARRGEGSEVFYTVIFAMEPKSKRSSRSFVQKYVKLKALCGPGDTMAPVITIMMPHED